MKKEAIRAPICHKCHIPMKKGMALENTLAGLPDFPNGQISTISQTGPPQMVSCWKCPKCGKSIKIH